MTEWWGPRPEGWRRGLEVVLIVCMLPLYGVAFAAAYSRRNRV